MTRTTEKDLGELFKMLLENDNPKSIVMHGPDVNDLFWKLAEDPAKEYRLWKLNEGEPVDEATEFDFSAGFVSGVRLFMFLQATGRMTVKAIDISEISDEDIVIEGV